MTPILVAAAAAVALAACGNHPVPRIAVPGTTIALLVPDGFPVGFGRFIGSDANGDPSQAASYSGSPLEDLQRGELVFKLVTSSGSLVSYLPLVHITRASIDESAPGSIDLPSDFFAGQPIAFVNIPNGISFVPGDLHYIEVHRYRRTTDGTAFELIPATIMHSGVSKPWIGWGAPQGPDKGVPLYLQTRPAAISGDVTTKLVGWSGFGGSYQFASFTEQDVLESTPLPRMLILVESGEGANPKPSAWEVELAYPAQKVRVYGAHVLGERPSSALVMVDNQSPFEGGSGTLPASGRECATTGNTANDDGSVRIQVIDPERRIEGVYLSYALRDDVALEECDRVAASDFVVASGTLQAYDADGTGFAAPTIVRSMAD